MAVEHVEGHDAIAPGRETEPDHPGRTEAVLHPDDRASRPGDPVEAEGRDPARRRDGSHDPGTGIDPEQAVGVVRDVEVAAVGGDGEALERPEKAVAEPFLEDEPALDQARLEEDRRLAVGQKDAAGRIDDQVTEQVGLGGRRLRHA